MDRYEYTDPYGDVLRAHVGGPASEPIIWITAPPEGIAIPLNGIDEYLTAMQALAETARRRANRVATEARLYRPADGSA